MMKSSSTWTATEPELGTVTLPLPSAYVSPWVKWKGGLWKTPAQVERRKCQFRAKSSSWTHLFSAQYSSCCVFLLQSHQRKFQMLNVNMLPALFAVDYFILFYWMQMKDLISYDAAYLLVSAKGDWSRVSFTAFKWPKRTNSSPSHPDAHGFQMPLQTTRNAHCASQPAWV